MKNELHVLQSTCCSGGQDVALQAQSELDTTEEGIKNQVRSKYAQTAIASQEAPGCGCGCGTENPFNLESYTDLEGYSLDADLGLGCGIPTEIAEIERGHDVLDLGSGAGVDAFVARSLVGQEGSVTGVDFTPEMVSLARANAEKLGFDNVTFIQGDIEHLPLEAESFDRVISNCVLNLVPQKETAFSEMHRVLRPGGRFTVSDIVLDGELPPAIRKSAEAYAGCVSGAITQEEYLSKLQTAGFTGVTAAKERELSFSDDFLSSYATESDIAAFRSSGARVLSITVTGSRP